MCAVILQVKGTNTDAIVNHVTSMNQINTVKGEERAVALTQLHACLYKECAYLCKGQGSGNPALELWKRKHIDVWLPTSASAVCICMEGKQGRVLGTWTEADTQDIRSGISL